MTTTEQLQGYLVVKVLEAAGHNGDDARVWDDNFKDAFVKSRCWALAFLLSSNLHGALTLPAPPCDVQLRSGVALAPSRYPLCSMPSPQLVTSAAPSKPRHCLIPSCVLSMQKQTAPARVVDNLCTWEEQLAL